MAPIELAGAKLDRVYIVKRGEVRCVPVGVEVSKGRLMPVGSMFGERSAVYSEPLDEGYYTVGTSSLLAVSKEEFMSFVSKQQLEKHIARELMLGLKFMSDVPAAEVDEIINLFKWQELKKGFKLCKANTTATQLYVLNKGEATVKKPGGKARITSHGCFGSSALLISGSELETEDAHISSQVAECLVLDGAIPFGY